MLGWMEVLPSSVGRYCTNLNSLKLKDCSKLKSIDSNLHALKHLKKFKLAGFTQLEKNPKDLFDEKCFLEELLFDLKYYSELNNLRPNPPCLPHLLQKLNLSGFKLKDGEIPCEIGEISNLQELHLCGNHFSRLDFSLSQLTRLKLLNLSRCYNLVELPELPSNIVVLQADYCYSLEVIAADIYSNCKWLSQVSIKSDGEGCRSLVGGVKLLESMLQGKHIENNHCMSLNLQGLEIPKGFEPRLVRGNRIRLKLAENWFNEYTGFLFCSVLKEYNRIGSVKITMRQEVVNIGTWDSQVFWGQESVNDDKLHTWVGYVSFGSLRCTAWLDQTSTAVDFSIDLPDLSYKYTNGESPICWFGARLVSKKNQMQETTAASSSSEISDDDYKCKLKIDHDWSLLECRFMSTYNSDPRN